MRLLVAVTAAVVVAVAAGCGSHRTTPKQTTRTSTTPKAASRTAIEKKLAAGGEVPNTCPKSIAANCIPGRMEGAIECVGRKGRIARTPTMRDFRRMDEEAAKAEQARREGKTPKRAKHRKPPATLSLHRLPDGRELGTCNYGGGPPVPVPSPASIAANE